MNNLGKFIVLFSIGMSILSTVTYASIYVLSADSHFQYMNDNNLTQYLNSITRFHNDSALTNTERIDILKTTHLATAGELSTIQIILDTPNPWHAYALLPLVGFLGIIPLMISSWYYDLVKEERETQ